MPEQTFRSPNFFEREIDLSAPNVGGPTGVPAGIIGTSKKGPAFVPVTVANIDEFYNVFGDLDPNKFGPYAVREFLKHKTSLTYLKVLGAGANATTTDIENTSLTGRVLSAGMKLDGISAPHDGLGRHTGVVQFITARHTLQANEAYGMPMFTDNDSFVNGQEPSTVNLVRGMLMLPTSSRVMVLGGNENAVNAFTVTKEDKGTISDGIFKLVISSSLGNAFSKSDGNSGIKIYSASLNPTSPNYIGKILNTDPDKFVSEQHYLYADFPVDNEIAAAAIVGVLSGSVTGSNTSGDPSLPMRKVFGEFDTRYTTPQSPWFISQPYGSVEYDLFKLESLDDGEYANTLYKISISNIKASVDDSNPYGTFTVQIRDWNDNDINPVILESYPNCTLNPTDVNYVAKLIGDRKVSYNFDAVNDVEKRIITSGKYSNVSKYVRVVMSTQVEESTIPKDSLPFGFRGMNLLKTNDSLTDTPPGSNVRLTGILGTGSAESLSGSILPPIPFRVKVTKGEVPTAGSWLGSPGTTEQVLSPLYWGVKFERNSLPLNVNLSSEKNGLLAAYTKFMGITKLDALVTGSGADSFNNNKFSLANVAFSNGSLTHLTASINDHVKGAAYVRNAKLDLSDYSIYDSDFGGSRITFATILSKASASTFNNFSRFTKFTTFMAGGWDGVNILDKNSRRMNDKATSFDVGGGAYSSYIAPGLGYNPNGSGKLNSNVYSYKTAIDIMTDPLTVNTNILALPGIRESYLSDYAMNKVKDYGLAYYVMDIPNYDDSSNRLYDDSTARPSVDQTVNTFDGRVIDNNYAGTYFPDVFIDDPVNRRRVKVPSSVAALGAIALNDRVAYPWFAPAGFNRAALDFVTNVGVRLNVSDRDRLYDSRINPIATFPRLGFVIYGQKTLQINKSALDRVNVRRLLLEVKRVIIGIAQNLIFEQNTPAVRNTFVANAVLQLGLIQAQSGVEAFQVIMNESNNTQEDIDLNRLNGKIVIVPTRVIEYIAIDFIITNSGVQFV